ncbi:SOS response-associated peptidase [Rhizobium mesosinicum]|uniref:Abasic site processing protein n=1 Tax=Rhizobium mesosinicum TaxID=335017 RepID=A0ABS7H078_9HYPH|nr:SOS response-associated peptidase [Rhizobium mesosinicum]MBW9055640.1 SOS response-associated peptidase [Rhizobium mesosinicum]
MCGRVFVRSDLATLMQAFAFAGREGVLGMANQFPRYNGAPSLEYPIIIMQADRSNKVGPVFESAYWGLKPAWWKAGMPTPVNARCEEVGSKPMFRSAYQATRCLIPIDGFFEWHKLDEKGKKKQPYAIAMKSGQPFALAGLWEIWRDRETDLQVRTFTIVTCAANEIMATIHDRMPVILHEKDYERWLSDVPPPHDLMTPFPSELMTMWPIGPGVGNPRNDRPDIIEEIDPDPEPSFL